MNKARWILISGVVAISAYGVDGLAQTAAAPAAPAAAVPVAAAPEAVAPAPAPVAAAPAPVAAAPAVAPAAANAQAQTESDHESVVGHLGVGYLGYQAVPFGYLATTGNDYAAAGQVANAPVVGIRYWFGSGIGLDAGFGLTTTFGNNSVPNGTNGTTTTNATAPTAFAVHGGIPLAFASAKHFTFELIPELNFGYAQQSLVVTDTAGLPVGTADLSGTHFDVGARVGAEVQFGFIGIPQLSLQGSVGLRADVNSTSTKLTPDAVGAPITTSSSSRSIIGTTIGNNPWDIFLGNIYAIYYL